MFHQSKIYYSTFQGVSRFTNENPPISGVYSTHILGNDPSIFNACNKVKDIKNDERWT